MERETLNRRNGRNKTNANVPCSMFHAAGFTLIELIVAVGLFSVIVAVAVGGFVHALRTERQVIGLLAANSNASLAIEQMAREIRTGFDFRASGAPGDTHELSFQNARGESVAYCLRDEGLFRATEAGGCAGSGGKITAESVAVSYLKFTVSGTENGDGYPPRVTVAIGVGSKTVGISGSVIQLQTTVSARIVDG